MDVSNLSDEELAERCSRIVAARFGHPKEWHQYLSSAWEAVKDARGRGIVAYAVLFRAVKCEVISDYRKFMGYRKTGWVPTCSPQGILGLPAGLDVEERRAPKNFNPLRVWEETRSLRAGVSIYLRLIVYLRTVEEMSCCQIANLFKVTPHVVTQNVKRFKKTVERHQRDHEERKMTHPVVAHKNQVKLIKPANDQKPAPAPKKEKAPPKLSASVPQKKRDDVADYDKLLTSGDVAFYCKVAPRTASKWMDSGGLESYRLVGSGDRRTNKAALVEFLKKHKMPIHPDLLPKEVYAFGFDPNEIPRALLVDAFDLGIAACRSGIRSIVFSDSYGIAYAEILVERIRKINDKIVFVLVVGEDQQQYRNPDVWSRVFVKPCDMIDVSFYAHGMKEI